jgi:hypothetical protein
VTTSSFGHDPLLSLPALTSGKLIDVISYGGIDELHKNPSFAPTSVDWIDAGHIVDRPLSVTEWNVTQGACAEGNDPEAWCFGGPVVPDRHTSPLFVASSVRYQGWDALMQYAYSQEPLTGPGGASNWEAYNDPSLLATLPAAALLYRRGDVQEAKTTYVVGTEAGATLRSRYISDKLRRHPYCGRKGQIANRDASDKGASMVAGKSHPARCAHYHRPKPLLAER